MSVSTLTLDHTFAHGGATMPHTQIRRFVRFTGPLKDGGAYINSQLASLTRQTIGITQYKQRVITCIMLESKHINCSRLFYSHL